MTSPYQYCPVCRSPLQEEERGGAPRLVCTSESCDFVYWNNPVPVVGAVVEHPEGVVLVQSIGWPAHFYGLVTGFLEQGEHPEEAVLREVKEETGLEGELGELIGLYPFRRMNQIIMVYHVKTAGTVMIDQEELADFRIVPLDKVRPWNAGTGYALQKWLNAKGFFPELIDLSAGTAPS